MPIHSKRALLTNACGALGYLSCLLLWAWVAILYLPIILSNKQIKEFVLPTPEKEVTIPVVAVAPSPLTLFFALITTIIVIVITVIVLIRVPVTVAKTGKTITTKVADTAVPLIARGKPLPAKEKRKIAARLIIVIKLLLIAVPLAVLYLSTSIDLALSFNLVILVAQFLAALAVAWFGFQYLSARLLSVGFDKLV